MKTITEKKFYFVIIILGIFIISNVFAKNFNKKDKKNVLSNAYLEENSQNNSLIHGIQIFINFT